MSPFVKCNSVCLSNLRLQAWIILKYQHLLIGCRCNWWQDYWKCQSDWFLSFSWYMIYVICFCLDLWTSVAHIWTISDFFLIQKNWVKSWVVPSAWYSNFVSPTCQIFSLAENPIWSQVWPYWIIQKMRMQMFFFPVGIKSFYLNYQVLELENKMLTQQAIVKSF